MNCPYDDHTEPKPPQPMQGVPEGYKQTEVGVIPEDWDLHSVGESMRLISGRAFKPSEWTDRGLPIIRIQNLNDPDGSFNFFNGTQL